MDELRMIEIATWFASFFKFEVGILAIIMAWLWTRMDASTTRMNIRIFRYGGVAFWLGLLTTHMIESYRLMNTALSAGQPAPLGYLVFLYIAGGAAKAIGLPIVVYSAIRWTQVRVITPAVRILLDRMIHDAETEIARRRALGEPELVDMDDADVAAVSHGVGVRSRGEHSPA